MRIAHLADSHLGFRQYGLYEREEDFYAIFEETVERIIAERPDCVIHAGDLFERSQPPTKALRVVQQALGRLDNAGIPIYAVPGNHDILIRRNSLPPHILYDYLGMKIIGGRNPWYTHGETFIGGIPYRSKIYHAAMIEDLGRLAAAAEPFRKRILVLHQAIETYLPFEYELRLEEIPPSFDYYAMGHIHKRIVETHGQGILAYPGSSELWSMDELSSYKRDGKGFNLVDLEHDRQELVKIDLPLHREILDETIPLERLEEYLDSIVERLRALPERPILNVKITDVKEGSAPVYAKLEHALGDLVLQLRPRFVSAEEENLESVTEGSLEIHAVIAKRCGDDSALCELALSLFDLLSRGDSELLEEASAMAEEAQRRLA
ncbi:MAG: DNA repair exonuclease [Methanomicrobiales archaeon]|nr:DNA repair exonuclease [Methanomicrobiales archaeon]